MRKYWIYFVIILIFDRNEHVEHVDSEQNNSHEGIGRTENKT